jgi:hypothetical protein
LNFHGVLIGNPGGHAAFVGGLLEGEAQRVTGYRGFLRGVVALGYEDVELVGPTGRIMAGVLFESEAGKGNSQLDGGAAGG